MTTSVTGYRGAVATTITTMDAIAIARGHVAVDGSIGNDMMRTVLARARCISWWWEGRCLVRIAKPTKIIIVIIMLGRWLCG